MDVAEKELLIQEVLEKVYVNLPKMVDLYLSQTDTIRKIAKDFYGKNPALLKHKYEVSKRLNTLMSEFPEKGVEDLLEIIRKEFEDGLQQASRTSSTSPVPGPIGDRRKVESSKLKNMGSLLRDKS